VPVVTDAEVEEQIGRLREQKATWLPVEGQRPSAGQMVQVDVTSLEEDGPTEPQPHSIIPTSARSMRSTSMRAGPISPWLSLKA